MTKQFIAEYWLSRAPQLNGWTFYSARQPSTEARPLTLEVSGQRFDPAELWIAVTQNDQDEKLDIMAWHPLFPKMEERIRWQMLFLLLDEVLGEYGTQNWIGEILIGDTRLKESIPVIEIKDFIDRISQERAWKKQKPTDSHCTYKIHETSESRPRGDVFVGGTRHFPLIKQFNSHNGQMPHPCPKLGFDLIYISINSAVLPKGAEVAYRSEIEDAIADALKKQDAGDTLGGALGHHRAYIDVVLFDGQRSLDQVRAVLKNMNVPNDTTIHCFTSETACDLDLK